MCEVTFFIILEQEVSLNVTEQFCLHVLDAFYYLWRYVIKLPITSPEFVVLFHFPRGKPIGNRIHPHIAIIAAFVSNLNNNKKMTVEYSLFNLHPLAILWYLKNKRHALVDTIFPVLISRVFEFLKWLVVKLVSIKITLKIKKQEVII